MNIIENDIKEILDNLHFPMHPFTTEDIDELIGNLDIPIDFTWENGVSKLAIIPTHASNVIKIPFDGTLTYEDSSFITFKNGGGEDEWDYCAKEMEIYYEIAYEFPEYLNFFVPLDRICFIEDHPIYIQPKVECGWSKSNCSARSLQVIQTSEDILTKTRIPETWLAKCLDYYKGNVFKLRQFLNFLASKELDYDLHSNNVGYLNNRPVILDYAGFEED